MKHLTKTTDRGLQFLPLILASVASTACGTLNHVSPSVLEGTDEQLMSALAQLAREGSQSICDPRVVGKRLGVIINAPMVERSLASDGTPLVSERSEIHVANPRVEEDLQRAGYSRFKSSISSRCAFSISFKARKICGFETRKFDGLMGVPLSYLGTTPHRWDFPLAFVYRSADGHEVEVSVGTAGIDCSHVLVVWALGEWK